MVRTADFRGGEAVSLTDKKLTLAKDATLCGAHYKDAMMNFSTKIATAPTGNIPLRCSRGIR
jgi:hypothetical protein